MHTKSTFTEKEIDYNEIINILGEEKIEKLHFIIGSATFSVAAVKSIIRKKEIMSRIQEGTPVEKIAAQMGISRMTVYRYLKNRRIK